MDKGGWLKGVGIKEGFGKVRGSRKGEDVPIKTIVSIDVPFHAY